MNFLGLWARGMTSRPGRRAMDSIAITAPTEAGRSGTGSVQYQLRQYAESTLGKSSLHEAVLLPEGESLDEWVACHIVDFYNHINMLFMSISHHCTDETCPKMCAGESYSYLWRDGVNYREPTNLPANVYVKLLMKWVDSQLDDTRLFPVDLGHPFPPNFRAEVASQILRRMLRVYAHLYWHHYPQICQVGLATMLNTSFTHFTLFVTKYKMVSDTELQVVKDVIKILA
ncbi:Mitotic exit network component [Coemansia sp. RSA 2671]|uniref:Mitotic exit network component n=2 Tax=Coemansia TaxID=4863 RepID=A0A9W8GR55_9FUNG|nr:Mitotic exit network component [Coemansia sp. S610]KAJ2332634.1 Mitotic exit network component [Coemansia sp. RSA 2671]KAJ2415564.1 Mitotic exit network component [Coemansia sp. RSA 2530]KAJ2690146.1 Mitotic exit network component [Coemansia spiralis]KAJ2703160.1 Mitotic exit network component [Coemansia sp. IMI 209128]